MLTAKEESRLITLIDQVFSAQGVTDLARAALEFQNRML